MNRNVVVTIVVVIIIALAAGGYYFMNQDKTSDVPSQAAREESTAQPSATIEKASLKSFMSMAGDKKCSFNDPETGNSGEVYLNAGMMRGDFSSNVNGKVTPSHMINDGKDVYIWMDDQSTGFKTSIQAIEDVSGTTGSTQAVDINKQVDYSCGNWTVDPGKFSIPTEIKFQDMGKMMQDAAKMMPSISPAGSGATSGNAAACAACDNLEGEQKNQCKTALKCN